MDVPTASLRCPITSQAVNRAPDDLVRVLRERQQQGSLRTRGGEIAEPFDGGLLTADGAWYFPIRSGIPVMLPSEAIPAAAAT